MEEIWKDIEGYEGFYQVSNHGRVKSLDRYVKHSTNHVRFCKGKELYISGGKSSYPSVVLYKHGTKPKQFQVHRLVAQAFVPNLENKPAVNHIDGDKSNNIADNLEWVTYSENTNHAIQLGLFDPRLSNLINRQAIEKRMVTIHCVETGVEYLGYAEAAKATGLSSESICRSIHSGCSIKGHTFVIVGRTDTVKQANRGKKVICIETSEEFSSITQAANCYNTYRDIIAYRLCTGKPLIFNGVAYHFKYKEAI